ncbi:DUF6252 family protein [Cochleicola gelatinilyticus]|uniref:Uncharacterized protein n=1 Tax=Cochleicola gelatinilyticus TaxID=1763537 RepID=A0A167IRK6_9FLAO|nr:DUF6252 family protein [Cochleicola gelatinilyticus]OAB79947.1 hypothetical protein ULVI_04200 [Cochleicola gelatinilyticus]
MRFIYALLLIVPVLSGCENVERNDPALQGILNSELYRAIDARATENTDGSFLIQGVTQRELLTLRIQRGNPAVYELGENSVNYASFEDFNGNTFSTSPNGLGEIVISNWDEVGKTLTGTFKFRAIQNGIDTLVVQRGAFFEVPYFAEDVDQVAGTLLARINGDNFNPFTISASREENSIIIKGSTPNKLLSIRLPVEVEAGSYSLPRTDFIFKYSLNNESETAVSGNLNITNHDPAMRRISGAFSFNTDSHTISLGQFNVSY